MRWLCCCYSMTNYFPHNAPRGGSRRRGQLVEMGPLLLMTVMVILIDDEHCDTKADPVMVGPPRNGVAPAPAAMAADSAVASEMVARQLEEVLIKIARGKLQACVDKWVKSQWRGAVG